MQATLSMWACSNARSMPALRGMSRNTETAIYVLLRMQGKCNEYGTLVARCYSTLALMHHSRNNGLLGYSLTQEAGVHMAVTHVCTAVV
eukprot:789513-Pelagomonas_calceolata.AAC.9